MAKREIKVMWINHEWCTREISVLQYIKTGYCRPDSKFWPAAAWHLEFFYMSRLPSYVFKCWTTSLTSFPSEVHPPMVCRHQGSEPQPSNHKPYMLPVAPRQAWYRNEITPKLTPCGTSRCRLYKVKHSNSFPKFGCLLYKLKEGNK